jgi:excisionase family DNA binding protein
VLLPRDQWTVLIPDHHRGFIDWATYEANTARLRENWRAPRGFGGGAPREGSALLQGRLRCGKCSRLMQTGYSGTKGNCPRYVCAAAKQLYGGEKGCQSLGGRRLEKRVLEEVFAVLEPAALAATAQALTDAEQAHTVMLRAFELTVERARYEAARAGRQYDAVEPENRLVARTLERALEANLAAQRQAERDLLAAQARRPVRLTEEELAWLSRAGADVRAVFTAASTTFRERKQLLRAIISEVVVTVDAKARTAALRIIWQGGACTELTMPMTKSGGHFRVTDEDTVELVQRLAVQYDDTTIAMILSRQHRRTGTGMPFTKGRVHSLRVSRGIPAYHPPETVTPDDDDAVVVTVAEAERLLGVGKVTIYRWLRDGFITGEQLTPGAPWRIRIDQAVRDHVVPKVPDGWLALDDAAKALGVARQTVLHKVQRGELQAVHVNRGQRKGLRINVSSDHAGLFDQPS